MDFIYLAEDALASEKPLKALHYFLKAYEETEDLDILIDVALLYQELGNDDKAFETFQLIREKDPEESIAYYGIATLLDDKEQYREAITYYLQAIELNPFYDRAYFFLAGAYDALGEKNKAMDAYKEALRLVPDDFWSHTNLGSIYEEKHEFPLAYKHFKEAYKLDATHAIASFNLGVISGKLGDFNQAVSFYEKSLQLDPTSPYTYLNLAILYKEHALLDLGIEVLSTGIIAAPEAFLYYNRACFYALAHQFDKSLSDLRIACERSPFFIDYAKKDPDLQDLLSLNPL